MTSVSDAKPKKWLKIVQISAITLVTCLLIAVFGFLWWESTWVKVQNNNPEVAFKEGSSGTEVMPLSVLQVLPDLFPDQFQPAGENAGDWLTQYGFIPNPDSELGLPIGISVSNYRPNSGAPSPVKFIGFSCILCHSSIIKTQDSDPGVLVTGMGNSSLDFIAWVDALRTSLLDEERLNWTTISQAYEAKFNQSLGITDRIMISLWLSSIRQVLQEGLPKFDNPYSGAELRDANYMGTGPSRTQPFRNLVRIVMDRPAATDRAYAKIPTVYEEGNRPWAQFDGSVRNPVIRSSLAALSSGATVENLALPEISNNITQSTAYTINLRGPQYSEVFPQENIDPEKVARGREVYQQSCRTCHGERDQASQQWIPGQLQGQIAPVEEIGTDPERVNFRYYDQLTDYLYEHFPEDHPLKPLREDLRPGPLGTTRGYMNAPLESLFSRAPYLHNGSVMTLAELINLKPRRQVFYRGANLYDPIDVGLIAPDKPDTKRYYKFDTQLVGNSNQGHDYPWAYQGEGWDQAALEDLLEFLKTLN